MTQASDHAGEPLPRAIARAGQITGTDIRLEAMGPGLAVLHLGDAERELSPSQVRELMGLSAAVASRIGLT